MFVVCGLIVPSVVFMIEISTSVDLTFFAHLEVVWSFLFKLQMFNHDGRLDYCCCRYVTTARPLAHNLNLLAKLWWASFPSASISCLIVGAVIDLFFGGFTLIFGPLCKLLWRLFVRHLPIPLRTLSQPYKFGNLIRPLSKQLRRFFGNLMAQQVWKSHFVFLLFLLNFGRIAKK